MTKTLLVFFCAFFSLSLLAKEVNEPKVIAVADVELGNPTAKLVFDKKAVRDSITQTLYGHQQHKVIDWSRLSAVLFRRNLEWSDVSNDDEARGELQEVLLNDYFLTGTVSHFSERIDYDGGAFSKAKTQVASAQIDLFVKDAITNEVIAASRGQAERSQESKQSLGFGEGAGANFGLAQKTLNEAIVVAIADLVDQLRDKK